MSRARTIPPRSSDEDWAAFLYLRTNPKGPHASAGGTSMAAGASSTRVRDTVSDRFIADLQGRRAAARPQRRPRQEARLMSAAISRIADRAAASTAPGRSASPSTASATRACRATRSPRRCSPTACIWSAARSSTTARAASCGRVRRSRTRSSPSSATTARYTPNLRATQVELYDGLVAESQNRWPSLDLRRRRGQRSRSRRCFPRASTTRPSCGRGGLEEASMSR